ncbi:MAG TPA: Eco57I restriction-modification methylase domain-containing protein [Leptospiraceae bacterium]|nr:Eco57I restriction-modification methylase domain-containing protein [Leptospiraceae bacterium]
MNAENADRIKKQNKKEISVIIGNPPYNANQQNENDNNKNREYPLIDERIKQAYIKLSTAQKTKVYDMYSRFFRWAMDRLSENGIISFVANRSFIDSRTFDGFRKYIQDNFDFAYIIDTKSDVRANPKISGTAHNVFGIQTGIAILFLIRKKQDGKRKHQCRIHYVSLDEYWLKEKKLLWLATNHFRDIHFEQIKPDKNNNWINIADNDFERLIPVCDKEVKQGKEQKAIFRLFSLGVVTNRDDWVYDNSMTALSDKVKFLINIYNKDLEKLSGKNKIEIKDGIDYSIKWTRAVKNDLAKGKKYIFEKKKIIKSLYRPFVKKFIYFSKELNEMQYLNPVFFGERGTLSNELININVNGKDVSFFSSKFLSDLHFLGDSQCLPLYTYDSEGNRQENITDLALEKFQDHYKDKKIKKENIFHYVYGVLHFPAYRKKYELNLKREFPRIPFYKDFSKWRDWGKKLMGLHLEYETVKPYKLTVTHTTGKQKAEEPKAKLKADREKGIIVLDENTSLSGIPKEAWEYKLGSRSALEWVLDQYKEKKPKDPTIAEKFNTYKFADYKEQVIELLKKVCTVSIETVRIVKEMAKNHDSHLKKLHRKYNQSYGQRGFKAYAQRIEYWVNE